MDLLSIISGTDKFIIICMGDDIYNNLKRMSKISNHEIYKILHYAYRFHKLGREGVKEQIRQELWNIMKRLQSGEAVQNAKIIYEQLNRQKKINETLPKASKFQKVFIPSDSPISEPNSPKPENGKLSGIEQLRIKVFEGLVQKTNFKTDFFSRITHHRTGKRNRIDARIGKGKLALSYIISEDNSKVELYIGIHGNAEKNKSIFDELDKHKDDIEKEFGSALDWDRNNSNIASQIWKGFDNGGFVYQETWPELQDEMVDTMVKFEKIFRPRLKAFAW